MVKTLLIQSPESYIENALTEKTSGGGHAPLNVKQR